MTGYKDHGEYVLPVTIDLMALLGHQVLQPLAQKTDLASLIEESANLVFSRQDEARRLDLNHFEPTDLFEVVPHGPEFQPGATGLAQRSLNSPATRANSDSPPLTAHVMGS